MTPDEWADRRQTITEQLAEHGVRIGDMRDDIDGLAAAQRLASAETRAALAEAVAGIGVRIEGFDNSCSTKVESLRAEIRSRAWTRPEKLTTLGLLVTIVLATAGVVLH